MVPGVRSLRTLEAAARHLNFSRAADELGVTPAAVSSQIKEIEDQVGVMLFARTNRSMKLTDAGAILCEAASEALDVMRRGTARARKANRTSADLTVTVDAHFAAKWLMQRLDSFRELRPNVRLKLDVSSDVREFGVDDVDIGIRYGAGQYSGLRAERLFDDIVVPVCSPRLLEAGPVLKRPRDLLHHTLVHVEWTLRGITWPNWPMWMTAAGIEDVAEARTVAFASASDVIEAALTSNVVALAELTMIERDLAENRLVRLFEFGIPTPSEFAYFLVYPLGAAFDHRVVAFRDWIFDQVRRSQS